MRQGESGFHLAQNLWLAQYQGIQPGSDPESMFDRIRAGVTVQMGLQLAAADSGVVAKPFHGSVDILVLRAGVDLGAVAGR